MTDKLSIGIKLRKNIVLVDIALVDIVLVDIDAEKTLYWILFKDDSTNKKKFYHLVQYTCSMDL